MRSVIETSLTAVGPEQGDGPRVARRLRSSHGGGRMSANHHGWSGRRSETYELVPLSTLTSPSQDAQVAGDARAGATLDSLISVPGVPAIVAVARRLVRAALTGSPRCDDIELVTSELLTNAICHSPSGEEGSLVTIRIQAEPGWARIEVTDRGSASWAEPPTAGEDEERGRGLAIVHALADKAGHEPVADGQVSWAEIHWDVGPLSPGGLRRI
jgi:anti-sigma regulatory factor (Ser/Thr protein kinase)